MPRPLGLLPLPGQPIVRPMFRSLAIAAGGISAQRQRMETVAHNLANAETTRTEDGMPYKRRTTVIQEATAASQQFGAMLGQGPTMVGTLTNPVQPFGSNAFEVPALADDAKRFPIELPPPDDGLHGVRVAGIAEDQTEGPLVYDPGHPDADANGYVRYPNVRVSDEMVELLDARRIYDANATMFQSAKQMLRRALDI